jgi:hypothetical protein
MMLADKLYPKSNISIHKKNFTISNMNSQLLPLKKNKTGMFVYCITDMTVTLIKNPPKNNSVFQFQCSNDVCCKQNR